MMYLLIAVLLIILIAVFAYIRHVTRRHVASLFLSTIHDLLSSGTDLADALKQTINLFVRRPPFNILEPVEVAIFADILQDLGSPVEVGAEILQQCETKHSAMEIKDFKRLARLAYATDLRLSLRHLIQSAKILHNKVTDRYPNITIALLASLSVREGWTFVEELNDALIFDYRQERVRIPKQGSGKDAARLILFEEMAQRPMAVHPETDAPRRSARKDLIDSFDVLFEEIFLKLGSTS